MKPRTFLTGALIAAFVLPAGVLCAASSSSDEQQIRKMEQDWGESYVKRDPAISQKMTTDDFVFIGPDGGVVSKPDYVKSITGPTMITDFKITEMTVRVYDGAA